MKIAVAGPLTSSLTSVKDDPRWRKHPRKRSCKRYDCDWVAAKARKRCKKKNKIGVRASEACECACA